MAIELTIGNTFSFGQSNAKNFIIDTTTLTPLSITTNSNFVDLRQSRYTQLTCPADSTYSENEKHYFVTTQTQTPPPSFSFTSWFA
jgi:hypothetical protein